MSKQQIIKNAFSQSNKEQSNIDNDVFYIGGFTSPKIRHLMNNLGAFSTSYLEVGVHRGAVLFSTLSNNPHLSAVAIDNFSEFEDGTVENELKENIKLFRGNVSFLKADCWTAPLGDRKFDLYLYDGAHDYESQAKAIHHYEKHFMDEVIVCVDDFDWADVQNGTYEGFTYLENYGVVDTWYRMAEEGYHNGFFVALLKRI